MSPRHALLAPLLATLLVLAAPLALAQDAASAPDQRPIEQRMTPAEFAASGLGKLSPEELANLNAWLTGTLRAEGERAAAQAAEKVKDDNRGFFHFGESKAITAHLQGHFAGFARNRQYTLDNGQVWRQTDSASLAGVQLQNPAVEISPSLIGSAWYMKIAGYNTRAKVERVK